MTISISGNRLEVSNNNGVNNVANLASYGVLTGLGASAVKGVFGDKLPGPWANRGVAHTGLRVGGSAAAGALAGYTLNQASNNGIDPATSAGLGTAIGLTAVGAHRVGASLALGTFTAKSAVEATKAFVPDNDFLGGLAGAGIGTGVGLSLNAYPKILMSSADYTSFMGKNPTRSLKTHLKVAGLAGGLIGMGLGVLKGNGLLDGDSNSRLVSSR